MLRKTAVFFILIALLTACGPNVPEPGPTAPVRTEMPTQPPTEVPTTPPTEAPTEPPHSDLYVPGVSVDDAIRYFSEVCLNAEFVNSGDPSRLQRWESPISYRLYGPYTPEDDATISEFAGWLNSVEGFPGIYEAGENDYVNLRIHFTDEQGLLDLMGDQFYGTDGAVTFWYDSDVIFDAIICIRTELDQHLRNSVILEEIYNGLGPVQDTDLRTDSLIYSGYSEPQSLTPTDELILKLLYHPSLSCGMNAAECEAAIRALYN